MINPSFVSDLKRKNRSKTSFPQLASVAVPASIIPSALLGICLAHVPLSQSKRSGVLRSLSPEPRTGNNGYKPPTVAHHHIGTIGELQVGGCPQPFPVTVTITTGAVLSSQPARLCVLPPSSSPPRAAHASTGTRHTRNHAETQPHCLDPATLRSPVAGTD